MVNKLKKILKQIKSYSHITIRKHITVGGLYLLQDLQIAKAQD